MECYDCGKEVSESEDRFVSRFWEEFSKAVSESGNEKLMAAKEAVDEMNVPNPEFGREGFCVCIPCCVKDIMRILFKVMR